MMIMDGAGAKKAGDAEGRAAKPQSVGHAAVRRFEGRHHPAGPSVSSQKRLYRWMGKRQQLLNQ
ncbi:MAG: hypothetical protein EON49_19055 [Acidovorax sp.]|nr:MAG: hypothetical protein EON49_19055 [Acidovorax sp.]